MKIPNIFDIKIYSEPVKINSLISKARVRIFYKGLNRNRTFISEEVADKLVNSLPYVPVKGIFDIYSDDFGDHGSKRQEGRAYGVVPGPDDMNFAWEEHEDDDGETRTYACVDVYLWTGLYEEASQIIDHPQSMELNAETIDGHWVDKGPVKYFHFTNAEFLGLQALGTEVTPAFEGAGFYALMENNIPQVMEFMYNLLKGKEEDISSKEGGKNMDKLVFKLSHEAVFSALFDALNPKCNSEGGWQLEYAVGPTYDNYAIATDYNDGSTYRVYYTVTDGVVTLGNKEKVYIVDVTESEYNSLQTLKALNGGNYEKVNETFEAATAKAAKVDEFEAQLTAANTTIGEHTGTINTLTAEKTALEAEKVELNSSLEAEKATVASLTEEVGSLKEFKLTRETEAREAVIAKFTGKLDEEELKPFTEKLEEYSAEILEEKLAYTLFKKNESVANFNFVPNVGGAGTDMSGVEKLIQKHTQKEEK